MYIQWPVIRSDKSHTCERTANPHDNAAADLFINMTSYFKYTIAITININQLCASE